MRRLAPWLSLAGALAGCSAGPLGISHRGDEAAAPAPATTLPTGCLAGVIEDGVTGQRLDLAASTLALKLYVQERNHQLPGGPLLPSSDPSQPNLAGEYELCNVPVEVALPLVVEATGYQTFSSPVLVASTSASQGPGADADLPRSQPTTQANVRLFPLAQPAQAFDVVVTADGAPVASAAVWLVPTGDHVAAQGSGFLTPDPTAYRPLSATTDASGVAAFKAADLALGGVYDYQVVPADPVNQQPKSGQLSVGYVTAPGEPYTFHVDLPPTDLDLAVVSSSLGNGDFHTDGSVAFVFNRAVELVPGSADGVTAQLDHAVSAKLATNQAGNDASEQVKLTVSGQTLTVAPVFKTAPTQAAEPGAGVTYAGIKVRPTSGGRRAHVLTLAPHVPLFGGVAAPSVATTVAVVSGGTQQASASHTLTNPVVVQVNDQYGLPMAGASVSFSVTSGGGSLNPPTSTTNAQGQAQAFWTLGASGTQAAKATTPVGSGGPSATLAASFLPPVSITVTGGDNQSWLIGNALPLALQVHLVDTNSVNVPDASVTFHVSDTTNGGLVAAVGGTPTATSVTVSSDASGVAQATWKLGSTNGAFHVTATTGSLSAASFTANVLTPSLAKTNGDGQTAAHGTAVTNPAVITVTDQNSQPIQGVSLHLVASGTGTVAAGGGGPATTLDATTNASGVVSATWTLSGSAGANTLTVTIPAVPSATQIQFTATGT